MSFLKQSDYDKLDQAHGDLRILFTLGQEGCPYPYKIVETTRTVEKQLEYFLAGKSRLDPRDPKQLKSSKHLLNPADAVDICVNIAGQAYDKVKLTAIADHLLALADKLYNNNQITSFIEWGGHWTKFLDMPHFQRKG